MRCSKVSKVNLFVITNMIFLFIDIGITLCGIRLVIADEIIGGYFSIDM